MNSRWSTSQVIQPARLPACARGKESRNKEPADVREPISETPSLQKHIFIRKLGSSLLNASATTTTSKDKKGLFRLRGSHSRLELSNSCTPLTMTLCQVGWEHNQSSRSLLLLPLLPAPKHADRCKSRTTGCGEPPPLLPICDKVCRRKSQQHRAAVSRKVVVHFDTY
ncbi:hypothetical protein QR685DRAFT_528842 [Neurospora intermedia]|uniref:Uncharacterized protein n=1 Tax=Neurospora intermedia TaxID=5142 RepID=A0ABR3D860_NEUIN